MVSSPFRVVTAVSRMGGGKKGCNSQKVKRTKVKSFKLEWLDETIAGNKTSLWLKPDVSDSGRALCTVCPAPCSINTIEGWAAVKQHGKTKKHEKYLKMSRSNPNFQQIDNSSPSIVMEKDEVLRLKKRCLERKNAVKTKEKEKKTQPTTHVSVLKYNHDYSFNL